MGSASGRKETDGCAEKKADYLTMKKKLTFISKLIVALLILPGGYVSAEQQDAEGLLIKARRALASTARILQQLETDTRKKSNVPFLAALRKMEPAMNEMQKGLDEKSSAYFSGLGTATVAAKEAAVTLVHSGLRDPRLIDSVKTLGHAVEVSRKFFGKEALRSKKGSALTDEEKLSFAKVQSSAASLLERLNELKSKHPADKELASQIDLLVASASRLNPKELTLQSYVEALLAADELEGLWSALSLYINNQYKPDWVHLSDTVEALVNYSGFSRQ
jgi:hypothetical protein